ncbi:MAG: Dfp1/Him1, central region-domain-containing protein [Benniella sp.]|nr:MAG: Dfp1/Him1, central region-domain-containing protein [Benniella sp.]
MAECNATSRLARAPLQERKGVSNIISGPNVLRNANAALLSHAGFSGKLGQENTVATFIPSSTAALARKPIAPQKTVSDGTDFQRARMASLQKPSAGVSLSTSKMYNASNHSISHPLLKVRQTAPLPESTSTSVEQRGPEKPNSPQVVSKRPTKDPVRPQPKHPYGSPEWIQGLALSLQDCRFYFDNVDSSIMAKLTKTLNIYGSTVRMFFSHDVTHVITTRKIPSTDDFQRSKNNHDKTLAQNQTSGTPTPPATTLGKQALKFPPLPTAPSVESCVLLKAMEYRIKIWSLERMMDLLTPLMTEPIIQKDNRNLQDFLRHEKVYGLTTTQNDDSSRPDYHVFRGPFVLIEDSTGRHRTILAYEYPHKDPQSHPNRLPWPRLHSQSTTRSPYLWYEEKPQRSKKKLEKGINDAKESAVKDTKDGQENPEENAPKTHLERSVAPSALVSGIVNSVTSNAVSTHSTAVKTQGMEGTPGTQGTQDRVLEQLGKRVLNSTKGEAGVITADTKKSEFVRPGDIIKSTKAAKPNVGRGADTGKAVPFQLVAPPVNPGAASNLQQVPTLTGDTTKQTTNELGLKPAPVAKTATQPVARKDYRPLGFCENCRGYYHDFDKHIGTAEHRRYAHDASKFEQLDMLLSQLQRKPKTPLPPAETDEDAICDTNIGQKPSSETAAAAEIADTKGPIKDSVIENAPVMTDEGDLEPFKALQPKNNPEHPTEARGLDLEQQHQQLGTGVDACTEHAQTSTSMDVTEDEYKDEDIVKPNVAEDDESDLSSVLSRLDVSETGEEPPRLETEADAYADDKEATEVHQPVTSSISHSTAVPLLTDPQDVLKTPTQVVPEPHSLLCHQFRTRNLDSEATSQLETDVTQPDERFLGGSVVDSQATDPAVPIRLSISMSSMYTDFLETTGTPVGDTYVIQEQPEGENDGLDDDDVALLKSPSAGRGTYTKAQAAQICKTFETAPAPARGSLKRKFEAILAEERAAKQARHVPTLP